jgi:multiple sugar transport system substrate-binding protein
MLSRRNIVIKRAIGWQRIRGSTDRLLMAVAAAAMLGLTGCSKPADQEPPTPPGAQATSAPAPGGTLNIVWAQWDPAKYLQQLVNDYAKETGVQVKVHEIPWPQFQQKVFVSLSARQDTYDIIVGDSQWLGRGSDNGHYLELTDWIASGKIDLASFYAPAVEGYSEYPKGSKRYWAVPCEADACGFCYRKDLFEDPKEKAAFKAKYGRELGVPKTWQELYEVAEFFHRPDKNQYGVALFLGKAYDSVTMGFQQVMWSYGGSYGDPATFQVEGLLNGPESVTALDFYSRLAKFAPPGSLDFYFERCLEAYQDGLVAMAMNYFAFFPGLTNQETNPKFYDKTGYFVAPAGPKGHYVSLGGQGMSISAYSKQQEQAKQFLEWFAKEEVQRKWAELGGYTCNKKILESEAFRNATPFNAAFADSLPRVRDFWAVPEYNELLDSCQKHWNGAVAGIEEPKAALDAIAREHTQIFQKAGRGKQAAAAGRS